MALSMATMPFCHAAVARLAISSVAGPNNDATSLSSLPCSRGIAALLEPCHESHWAEAETMCASARRAMAVVAAPNMENAPSAPASVIARSGSCYCVIGSTYSAPRAKTATHAHLHCVSCIIVYSIRSVVVLANGIAA